MPPQVPFSLWCSRMVFRNYCFRRINFPGCHKWRQYFGQSVRNMTNCNPLLVQFFACFSFRHFFPPSPIGWSHACFIYFEPRVCIPILRRSCTYNYLQDALFTPDLIIAILTSIIFFTFILSCL